MIVVYPVAVWWCLTRYDARVGALVLLAAALPALMTRARLPFRQWIVAAYVPLSVVTLLSLGALLDDRRFVMAMPVAISLILLLQFGASLASDMPMVERFARLYEADLSDAQRAHCRQFTIAWCVFFVVNALIAGGLALLAPVAWWTLYAGAVAYVLMGFMFASEYIVRRLRFGSTATKGSSS